MACLYYNTPMNRLGLAGLLALGSAYGAALGATCDRSCLKTTLDQYLAAVVEHNPAAAPLSVGFRQTENAMVRQPGTGLWQSAKALGKLQRRYFDAESGQAGYFGTVSYTHLDVYKRQGQCRDRPSAIKSTRLP